MSKQKMAAGNALFVAAIDFGTTYSGVAFSSRDACRKDPTDVNALAWTGQELVSSKGPTSILITSDGNHVDCFGYEAESKYSDLADEENHKEWYYFRRFKMLLHGDKATDKDVSLEDATGKKLSAMKVFTLSIEFLKNKLLKEAKNQNTGLEDSDFHWVLTVPAIWNDTAKHFMRKAAEGAGIEGERLTIALEPEVASLYCRNIPVERSTEENDSLLTNLKEGSKYLVLDAGGGTVDITVHCVSFSGELKEVHQASGGAWGGTKVDEQFEDLLRKIIGGNVDISTVCETFIVDFMKDHLQVREENFAENLDKKVEILLGKIFCTDFDITALCAAVTDELKGFYKVNAGKSSENKVGEQIENLLRDRIGYFIMEKYKKDNMFDNNALLHSFELKKRTVSSSKSGFVIMTIPASLIETIKEVTGKDFDRSLVSRQLSGKVKMERNKLKIDVEIFKDFFQFSIKSIVSHLENLLQHESVRGCGTIMMVGGFSESEVLQDEIRKSFPSMKIVIPKDPGLAVLKGAVIFGHNPTAITERICKYTYGKKALHKKSDFCTHPPGRTFVDDNGDLRCDDMFQIHVKKGQAIKLGEKQREHRSHPMYDTQTDISLQIYASTEENPVFVTDSGCQKIGKFKVPVTGGREGNVGTSFMFGGTEIEVIVEDKLTGKITKHRVEFLG